MPGLQMFKKGFYSHIGANQPIVAGTINLGSTKGRGSSTRMFNYCNQHSANKSECINQFINITPAPAPPAPYILPPNTTILEYNTSQVSPFTWGSATFTLDTNLSNFSYTAITTSIPASIVPNLTNLIGVTIGNSVTSTGNSAFYGCSALTSVSIPNSVTSISGSAFQSCSALISVSIPNSVTSIGAGAFNGCSALTSVSIPNSVTSISAFTFQGCSALTSVSIPNSLTSIGQNAFYDCSDLTSVTIGNNVTSIGVDAFVNSGLTTVYISATVAAALGTPLGYTWTSTVSPGTSIPNPQFYGAPTVNFVLP